MKAFFDTSALLKRYIREDGTDRVEALFSREALAPATSRATWAESVAAVVRRHQAGHLRGVDLAGLLDLVELHLDSYFLVDVDDDLVRRLRPLSVRHGLRGYDLIQLASALHVAGGHPETWTFVCSDRDLCTAAHEEGFVVLDPTGHWEAPAGASRVRASPSRKP
jgi:predicted nucleic acid-binding protein